MAAYFSYNVLELTLPLCTDVEEAFRPIRGLKRSRQLRLLTGIAVATTYLSSCDRKRSGAENCTVLLKTTRS